MVDDGDGNPLISCWEAQQLKGKERESEEMEQDSVTVVEGDREERRISELPQDMKKLIFAKLSFESIWGSRIVCKEWNFILSSHSFLSSLPTQNPWLLICGRENDGKWYCMTYCFSSQKWMTLPLSFPPNLEGGKIRVLSGPGEGLLLFGEIPTGQLFAFNPLMRSYAEIEMDLTDKFIYFVQGGNEEPYLIVYSNSPNFSFKIYHYIQDSWRIKFQFAGETRSNILGNKMVEMVECNGVLFWRGMLPTTIVGYKIQDEGFVSPVTVAPLPPKMVQDLNAHAPSMLQPMNGHGFSMVSYGSSVLVVGTFKESSSIVVIPGLGGTHPSFDEFQLGGTRPKKKGIVIWELFEDEEDELIWNWKEFARMPPQSLPEYLDASWNEMCVCVGDYLCFSSLYDGESAMVFAYNLREGFWQCLPACKIQCNKRMMMSFEPKLNHYQFLRKLGE